MYFTILISIYPSSFVFPPFSFPVFSFVSPYFLVTPLQMTSDVIPSPWKRGGGVFFKIYNPKEGKAV
jgi:hypothetical protein